jgi:hypothetical protein
MAQLVRMTRKDLLKSSNICWLDQLMTEQDFILGIGLNPAPSMLSKRFTK